MKKIGLCVVTVMALLVLAGKNVLAGGGDFEAEILSFREMPDGTHEIEMMQYSNPWYSLDKEWQPKRILIRAKFKANAFIGSRPDFVTKKRHNAAIRILKEQSKKGGIFHFGIYGEGWLPVKGKENTFQSYALSVLKTYDNRNVVFSIIW